MKTAFPGFNKKLIFFYLFIILGFVFFSYLANLKRNKMFEKKITVITDIDFIDSIFSNALPFIEPGSLDHFSYDRKRLQFMLERFKNIYGYDLTDRERFNNDCSINNFRTASLDKCFLNNYWSKTSISKWRSIAKEYGVFYLVTAYEISNLKKCFVYDLKDKKKPFTEIYDFNAFNLNHYILPTSNKEVLCEKLLFKF